MLDSDSPNLLNQRPAVSKTSEHYIPSAVDTVINSPGQPLDKTTCAFMEPRFGNDFTSVRVHTDQRAAESARAMNAFAFTVGQNIVFDTGQYQPHSTQGQELIAHELTHIVQQRYASNGAATIPTVVNESSEREAARVASAVVRGAPASITLPVAYGTVQRQSNRNPLDQKAKAIITKAKDTTVSADKRAVQLVRDIINEYYANDATKVDSVVFDDAKAGTGLNTESSGSGATTKGKISVGNYFVEHVDAFARRVLQVGHELEHIDQYRSGLAGGQNKDKREFLAFYDEAMAAEKPGTGRMSFSTRLALIDAALGYYYCLSGNDPDTFESKKDALLKRRDEFNGKGGNAPTNAPTSCKRQ